MITLFEIELEGECETQVRDEFGWVDGCAPGNGKYKPTKHIYRLITDYEDDAKLFALSRFKAIHGFREMKVVSCNRISVDAIIEVRSRL